MKNNKSIFKNFKRNLRKMKKLDLVKFIYWNYFSKCIVREKKCYLLTMKNSIIDIDKSTRIYIKGKSITIGYNKLRKSKAETYLRMGKNAKWISNGGADLYYNSVIEVKDNAVFETGYFNINSGCTIIATRKIKLGNNVMMGRNNIVYDSDFHQILDSEGKMTNPPKEVVIGDNVWLTSNVTVLKGVNIGKGSIITAQTLVRKDLPMQSLAGGGASAKVINSRASWNRKSNNIGENT